MVLNRTYPVCPWLSPVMACTRDSGDSSTGAVTVRLRQRRLPPPPPQPLSAPTNPSRGCAHPHHRDGRACRCWRGWRGARKMFSSSLEVPLVPFLPLSAAQYFCRPYNRYDRPSYRIGWNGMRHRHLSIWRTKNRMSVVSDVELVQPVKRLDWVTGNEVME